MQRYGHAGFEGNPCFYALDFSGAWVWFDDGWHSFHPAEIAYGAGVESERSYFERFGKNARLSEAPPRFGVETH
jgi:hypothetical protein